jgi:ATP-dependent DNA ligase
MKYIYRTKESEKCDKTLYAGLNFVKPVSTYLVNSEEDFRDFNTNGCMANGYEGAMIRNGDGIYKLGHRSADLQKLKEFQDAEYKIIGFKEGTGTEKGCVIWECSTDKSLTFSVRPRGSKAERQGYFQNGKEHIGSMLTVRFQELTNDGIPRFPVGISIRDYE